MAILQNESTSITYETPAIPASRQESVGSRSAIIGSAGLVAFLLLSPVTAGVGIAMPPVTNQYRQSSVPITWTRPSARRRLSMREGIALALRIRDQNRQILAEAARQEAQYTQAFLAEGV